MVTKNTVILVYPKIDYEENYKYNWTPFSILALAGTLELAGFTPILLDQNADPSANMFSRVEALLDETLFVGFSIMTGGGQIGHAVALAAQIRDAKPNVPLVWGGPHVSAMPEQTAAHNLVDIAVAGQGDMTVVDIAQALKQGNKISEIPGAYVKGTNGELEYNSPRSFIKKESLPNYPWHLVSPQNYIRNDITINTATFGYVSSQGCPYRCRFCYEFGAYNAWWSGFEATRIVDDIEGLAKAYGINGVKFYDADFFVKASRVEQFCLEIARRELPIKWAGSANPNDILRMRKRESGLRLLDLVRDTQCTRILMGMESGSDRMLDLIDKQVTSAQLREVAQIIADYGIIGSFTFIVGFPGETPDDLEQTIELVEYIHQISNLHETRLHIFAPYPGTPLFEAALKHGFSPHTSLEMWSNYNYYQPQTPWVDDETARLVREYTRMH